MLTLLAHEGHGAESIAHLEKDFTLKVDGTDLDAALILAYKPEKHTFEATSLDGYLNHMLGLNWASVSDFTHTLAADLYDHALPFKLTLEVAAEHEGFTETVEAKHKQPK